MKIKSNFWLLLVMVIAFLSAFDLAAQGVTQDTLINGVSKSTLDLFFNSSYQVAYVFLLWGIGRVIKLFGDKIPILKSLPSTTYRVAAYAVVSALLFWKFSNESVTQYLQVYAIGTSLYELGIKWAIEYISNIFKDAQQPLE